MRGRLKGYDTMEMMKVPREKGATEKRKGSLGQDIAVIGIPECQEAGPQLEKREKNQGNYSLFLKL